MKKHKVVIVEDHMLLSQAIAGLVNSFEEFEVPYICMNGQDLLDNLEIHNTSPDIVLMDVKMPIMDGVETTGVLKCEYPDIKVIALSVEGNEETIISMLKAGAKGYLMKDVEKTTLELALKQVMETGYYHTTMVTNILVNSLNTDRMADDQLKEREIEFIKLVCSELTYKEIADKMFLSPKTIDGYRDSLFQKLNIKNKIGLVLYAIKNKIVNIND